MKNNLWVLVILASAIGIAFSISFITITGEAVSGDYTYTKAICGNENSCEDYEIVCSGKDFGRMSPTGFSIQLPEDWKDSRSKEEIDKLC